MHNLIPFPIVELREEATLQSKVASQALFGETVQIKERGEWHRIATSDGYLGWVQSGSLITRQEPYRGDIEVTRLSAHLYAAPDTEYGPLMTLPFGSKLQELDASDVRWVQVLLPDGRKAFIQKGDLLVEPFELISFSKKFLGLPYTWGGRSSFGFDCSGFVQMVYGRMGIRLPRDAREQIAKGKPIAMREVALGDLIFWGKSEREIKHVGMCLEREQFIHASARENKPYLRISKLSDAEWSGQKEAFYPFRTARRFI